MTSQIDPTSILALDIVAPAWTPKAGDLVVVTEGAICYGARVITVEPGAARGGGLAMVQGTGLNCSSSSGRWGERWLACLADIRPGA